jgi:DNA ligase-1
MSIPGFAPLLASKADLEAVTYPVLASPKLDGIRAFTGILPGFSSRKLKAIPNKHIQAWAAHLPPYLDGELLTYTDGVRDEFNTVQSKVMSSEGEPEFRFHVFDHFADPTLAFHKRIRQAELHLLGRDRTSLRLVPHVEMHGVADLIRYEQACVDGEGWEGIMIRHPDGRYKFGRSTAREGILLKVKRFEDDEAIITGTVEQHANTNALETDHLGFAKRSSHKAGMVPKGTLGAISAHWKGVDFEIGTGFTDEDRASLWADRESLIGQKVTFKFQGVGSQGRPRFPSFSGIRRDL